MCVLLVLFLLFTPAHLASRAKDSFRDARFERKPDLYRGTIVLYHIVRERPYTGSLTAWLTARAEKFEKQHKGTYILIEGMDERTFLERIGQGRIPDAYSFFSGSLWKDRLCELPDFGIPFRDGLTQNTVSIPYAFTGFAKITKQDGSSSRRVYANCPVTAARIGLHDLTADEEKADVLYVDLRRAGDLIRYHKGFENALIDPVDNITEAVCWLGVDRGCEPQKYDAIVAFFHDLLLNEAQIKLNELGMLSVRNDIRDVPPDPILNNVFTEYCSVQTFDPFRWQREYDSVLEDAILSLKGDSEAMSRFTIRLQDLYS